MKYSVLIFSTLIIMSLLFASGALAPSVAILQNRDVTIKFATQNGSDLTLLSAQQIEETGLLEIHSKQVKINQGNGEIPVLSFKNNFPEIIDITVQLYNKNSGWLFYFKQLTLLPGDESDLILVYDTSNTPPNVYSIEIVVYVASHSVYANLLREINIEIIDSPPVVEAGHNQFVKLGESVNFSGSFNDYGDIGAHSVAWNFGDSTSCSDQLSPWHIYQTDGQYTASLTVVDSNGGIGTDTVIVTVEKS